MIYRFSGAYLGADVSNEADLSSFPDSANIQPYARQAMAWAVEQGIILGSDGKLKPQSQALRTELAAILKKTPSACSQIVRKLRAKGWVEQVRNAENNRIYNLYLTESGKQVYQAHTAFNQSCQEATFQLLSNFSPEELEHHLMVQRKLNEAYQDDVRRSRDYLG